MTETVDNPIRIPRVVDLEMKTCVDAVNEDVKRSMSILSQIGETPLFDVMLDNGLERMFTRFVKDFMKLRMYVHTKENLLTLNSYGFDIDVMNMIIYVCSEISIACMEIIDDVDKPALYRVRASSIAGISISIDSSVTNMIYLANTNMDRLNIDAAASQIAKYEQLLSKYETKLQQYEKMIFNMENAYTNVIKTISAVNNKK
jgi:hypothetical protein